MADDREKISTGPNEEPINETIAGTGPGIPDDALAPGEELARSLPQTKRSNAWPRNCALLPPKVIRFRWKVNESRRILMEDSVTVQFSSLSSAA